VARAFIAGKQPVLFAGGAQLDGAAGDIGIGLADAARRAAIDEAGGRDADRDAGFAAGAARPVGR